MIISGDNYVLAITEKGEVFSWGNNDYGQLGLGHNNHCNTPQLVEFFNEKQIKNIISGSNHVLAMTEEGEVFSWGCNHYGQLGLGHNNNCNTPQLVEFFNEKQIRNIISGGYHVLAITEEGEVFSWGKMIMDNLDWIIIIIVIHRN